MALIQCPECGREVSDQAPACIHCGYPLVPPKEPRYALVLLSIISNYSETIKTVQEELKIDSYPDAKALVDRVPVVLQRDMDYPSCLALSKKFQPHSDVKVARDQGENESVLIVSPEVVSPSGAQEDRQGLGFGGTVLAVVLGVIAAIVILSFL